MVVRSQNKKYTTTDMNLEIVTKEYYPEFGDGDKTIESKIYNSVGLLLATYSTEEKAIKVLNMICKAYENYRGGNVYEHSIFNMPSDEEVEV